jgi:hypothetical protein
MKNLIAHCFKIVSRTTQKLLVGTFQITQDNNFNEKLTTLGATFTFHITQKNIHLTSMELYHASAMNNII